MDERRVAHLTRHVRRCQRDVGRRQGDNASGRDASAADTRLSAVLAQGLPLGEVGTGFSREPWYSPTARSGRVAGGTIGAYRDTCENASSDHMFPYSYIIDAYCSYCLAPRGGCT